MVVEGEFVFQIRTYKKKELGHLFGWVLNFEDLILIKKQAEILFYVKTKDPIKLFAFPVVL